MGNKACCASMMMSVQTTAYIPEHGQGPSVATALGDGDRQRDRLAGHTLTRNAAETVTDPASRE